MDETQRGKYTFAVHDDANKLQIKAAVEELFKVTVRRRQRPDHQGQGEEPQPQAGRVQGWTSPWKKAVVTVAAGDKIEFFEGV